MRRAAALTLALVAAACSRSTGDGGAAATVPTTAPGPPPSAAGAYAPPERLGRLTDPALVEASGLAVSLRNRGRLWAHNDSGAPPLIHCLDEAGRACGTWTVTGADARDWEDMAAGPGPRPGVPYLYVGDIGDNLGSLAAVVVYRFPEPEVGATPGGAEPGATEPAEAIRLRYPDGPHDAEALLVNPASGDLYVVTKEAGAAGVYRARAPLDPATTTTMERVAVLGVGTGTPDPRARQVTGGDIAPDAARVILSTYGPGYELVLPPGASTFDDIWSAPLAVVELGPRLQGEAVAYGPDGAAIFTTSEGGSAPLLRVRRR